MAEAGRGFLKKSFASLILIVVLLSSVVVVFFFFLSSNKAVAGEDIHVGVAFCGNTTAEARLLIDRVNNYTNLFVLQSGPVSKNETATNEICDYATECGLDVIVYFGDLDPRILSNETDWRVAWIGSARARWGDQILGIYYYDEPGGIYIDCDWKEALRPFDHNGTYDSFVLNRNYEQAADFFVNNIRRDPGCQLIEDNNLSKFVSDYALYWFDYLAGYDVIFAEIGWNHSMPQDIALIRGAADLQRKEWGVIIGWKYTVPPYLDSGDVIYGQMIDAYRAGAKYVVVFNYPQLDGNDYGVLKDEHFEAIEQFWNNAVKNPSTKDSLHAEVALVLPRNYAWGMRHPEDRIWGHWGPDEKSSGIWNLSRSLLSQYGLRLHIIYDDPNYPLGNKYTSVYYWNQTSSSFNP